MLLWRYVDGQGRPDGTFIIDLYGGYRTALIEQSVTPYLPYEEATAGPRYSWNSRNQWQQ